MAYELYQILEVSPQATALEIKRAYFSLVRKYSPEKNPEKFKQIREAYNTLSDEKAKQNYDSLQQYGDQIKDLINQAEEKMNAEECQSAIPLLKKALVLAPAADGARNLLGLCYINIENWDFAVKVYRTLTKTNPDVPVYWSNFGHTYKQQADSLDDQDALIPQLYHNARECFQKAIKLESFNSQPYLDIAVTYFEEGNHTEALAWAESAINADGKADVYDIDTLFFICRVHLFNGEFKKIEETAQRIALILPDSEESRRYAASRFASMGFEVTKIGIKLADVYILRAAIQLVSIARDFAREDLDINELYKRLEQMIVPLEQYELLKNDSLILEACQKLVAFCLADYFNLHNTEQERKDALDEIIAEIFAFPSRKIISSIKRIKTQYCELYALNKDLFNRIEHSA